MNWPSIWKLFKGEIDMNQQPDDGKYYEELLEFKRHVKEDHVRIEAKIDRILSDIRDES